MSITDSAILQVLEPGETRPPAGMLVYAIGDVHGCIGLLNNLLDSIARDAKEFDAERRMLVFVGDYIDRGPNSAAVVERISTDLPLEFDSICLQGNHEAMMLNFLDHPDNFDLWDRNGAEATLASYGMDPRAYASDLVGMAQCRAALLEAIPAWHMRFFKTLNLSATLGDYFFAHAGVLPGTPLDRQRPSDLMWVRHDFLDAYEDFGKLVVHGHTPMKEPEVRSNRISIDTGVWKYGRLTALRLHQTSRAFLTVE